MPYWFAKTMLKRRQALIRVLVFVLALIPGLCGGIPRMVSDGSNLFNPFSFARQMSLHEETEEHLHVAPRRPTRTWRRRQLPTVRYAHWARMLRKLEVAAVERPSYLEQGHYALRDPRVPPPDRRGPPVA